MSKKLTAQEIERIVALRMAGGTHAEIAAEVGRPGGTIGRVIQRAAESGVVFPPESTHRPGRRPAIDRAEIVALRNSGLRIQDIAEQTGWSVPGLRKVLRHQRQAGVEVKSFPPGRRPLEEVAA